MRKHLLFITLCLVLAAITLPPALAWFGTPSLMISGGGSGGQTIASVSLSSSTFTNNTANATVGTISVTMNPPSPAFSCCLSITTANSGSFHIVGTTLLTNAAGTTSGTYSDVTIVAAQAGAGSASISPTLVGSNVAVSNCDYGKSAPIPAPAQKAGFTHCLVNADFTDTTHVPDGNAIDWSNPNTWAGNCGTAQQFNAYFFLALQSYSNGYTNVAPCNRLLITTDAANGNVQVFDLQFRPTDWTAGGYDAVSLNWPVGENSVGCVGNGPYPGCPGGGPNRTGLPRTMYAQIRYRITADSFLHWTFTGNQQNIVFDFWQDGNPNHPQPDYFIESDYYEATAVNAGGCANPTNCVAEGNIKVGYYPTTAFTFDTTQYNTIAGMVTMDNDPSVLTLSHCGYLNGGIATATPVGPVGGPAGTCMIAGLGTLSQGQLTFMWGNQAVVTGACATFDGGYACTTANLDILIQSIQYWSCPGVWTANCNTHPLITSEADETPFWGWAWNAIRALDPVPEAHATEWQKYIRWVCPDGSISVEITCMPDNLKVPNWWDACVPGRDDCVRSDTAIRGWHSTVLDPRGPGYCYSGQPYTCDPDGVWPR